MKRKFFLLSVMTIVVVVTSLMLGTRVGNAQGVDPQYVGKTVVYNLYATDGYVTLADGSEQYIYGFVGGRQGQPLKYMNRAGDLLELPDTPAPTGGPITGTEAQLAGNAQFPGPVIYATTNDVVEIRLKNLGVTAPDAPNDPHTIHLHGLDVDAANDGVPETSLAAVPANSSFPGAGNVIVYMFAPKRVGTSMYHCHQEANIHVQMGMYGALVIYNPSDQAAATGPGMGKGGNVYGWKYDKDVILLLSEFDIRQHQAEETADGPAPIEYNSVDFKPQYWFINGLSFPNTIHAGINWDTWIAAHPGYDPYIVGSVSKAHPGTRISNGEKILLRVINLGFQAQPMHMHGFHAKVLGSDQRAWPWANLSGITPTGQGLEKNTLFIGSGETYEWLLDMGQQATASTYPTGTQTRYDPATGLPVSNTQTGNPVIPIPGEEVTYIGGPQVTGAAGLPTTGQLFPFHNHDDYKATNNGAYPGGMFTMIQTLP